MAALPPAIQPDGHQRQQRKPLLTQLKLHAEQPDGVHQPAQKHHVDPVQGQHLSQQAPPFPAPENVKSEHGQHTGTVVIRHAQRSQQRPCCCHCGAHRQRDPELLLFAHRFHQMHPQKPQQQRPDDVLVHRVEPSAAVHQVKGDLRKQSKQQQPQGVFFQVMGVEIALHRHKRKDGKRQPPGTSQPLLRRQKGRPQVIHQHQRHGNDMKCCCTQVNAICGSGTNRFG